MRFKRNAAVALALTFLWGCGFLAAGQPPGGIPRLAASAATVPAPAMPEATPVATASPGTTPAATASAAASPAPAVEPDKRLAFVLPGDPRLFYWDPPSIDVHAIPGAGPGAANVSLFDDDRRIAFDRGGACWAYDLVAEVLFRIPTSGECIDPYFNGAADVMLFHNAGGVFLWFRGSMPDATGSWPPPPGGPTVELAKFGQVARLHGGIVDAALDADTNVVIALTGDGRLWRFLIKEDLLSVLLDLRHAGDSFVTGFYLDPTGKRVAFVSATRMFLLHLDTLLVDPLPYVSRAYNADSVTAPVWISPDEFHFLAFENDQVHLLRYAWRTGILRTSTTLNLAGRSL